MAMGLLYNNLGLSERLAGVLICFVPLLIVNIFSKNGFGMGDVKLIGTFGFVLGAYGGLFSAVCGLTIMLLTSGVCQLCKKTKKAVPLAPFLCGGFALILILENYL
jgi:prepilin signal peptidase PulO-like enzyme (type II secretory pathway)